MKKTTRAIGVLSFLLMLGIVGGMECGTIALAKGAILAFASLAVSAFSLYKGGVLR